MTPGMKILICDRKQRKQMFELCDRILEVGDKATPEDIAIWKKLAQEINAPFADLDADKDSKAA